MKPKKLLLVQSQDDDQRRNSPYFEDVAKALDTELLPLPLPKNHIGGLDISYYGNSRLIIVDGHSFERSRAENSLFYKLMTHPLALLEYSKHEQEEIFNESRSSSYPYHSKRYKSLNDVTMPEVIEGNPRTLKYGMRYFNYIPPATFKSGEFLALPEFQNLPEVVIPKEAAELKENIGSHHPMLYYLINEPSLELTKDIMRIGYDSVEGKLSDDGVPSEKPEDFVDYFLRIENGKRLYQKGLNAMKERNLQK
ncbi:hypothetical protein HYT57_01030 [Candidatus Woesearchaeota archaeon]|nr:hypothetical protein [Candidatus Woesearchaeota archaeon]